MYLPDFDLTKYDQSLYLFADLCIQNRGTIINHNLYKVTTKYSIYEDVLVLYYDTSNFKLKEYNWLLADLRKEPHLMFSNMKFIDDKRFHEAVFKIPKDISLSYIFRKSGLKNISSITAMKMFQFWGEYCKQIA